MSHVVSRGRAGGGVLSGAVLRGAVAVAALATAAVFAVPAHAQKAKIESVLRKPLADAAPGIPVGTFVVHPRLEVEGEYDDNIFRTRSNKQDDFIFKVRPGVRIDSDWEVHYLSLYAQGEVGRYARTGSESYFSYGAGAAGRFDIDDEWAISGGIDYSRALLQRGQAGTLVATGRNYAEILSGRAALEFNGDPVFFRVGPRFARRDYTDKGNNVANGDHFEYGVEARLGYRVTPDLSVFVEGGYTWVRYDKNPDPFGFNRDNQGYDIRVGLAYDLAADLSAEIALGYFRRHFKDSALPSTDGVSARAALYWNPTQTLSFEVEARRGFTEYRTVDSGVASRNAVETYIGLRGGWLAMDNLLVDAGVYYARYDYRGIGQTDHYYGFDIGAKYYFNPYIYAGPRYIFTHRSSSSSQFNYTDNRILLTVGGQL